MFRQSFPLAIALLALGASLTALAAPEAEERRYDCGELADASEPTSPAGWLKRGLLAGHCYVFQARAVRISRDSVRTLALSHDVQNGKVREMASYLDGPPVVHEHRGKIVRSGVVQESDVAPLDIARIENHYRLTLGEQERVAGRESISLDIEPLDNLRYGHRLWLDLETGLPLKQVLLDIDGRVLETFLMTELVDPALYRGAIVFEVLEQMPAGPWRPGWLPAGYELSPLPGSRSVSEGGLSHRLYSDGLSSFSLFVEPLDEEARTLRSGLHRLGISYAAVRHMQIDDRLMQVVVMGELPPQVLVRVAAALQYRPAVEEARH